VLAGIIEIITASALPAFDRLGREVILFSDSQSSAVWKKDYEI